MKLETSTITALIDQVKSKDARNKLIGMLKNQEIPSPTCPNTFSEDVALNCNGETAYQRAIISEKKPTSILSNAQNEANEVQWLDIELPIVFGKSSRRNCLDLIGKTTNDKKIVLCELKYVRPDSNSYKSNNPVYALLELLIYYHHIQNNAADLEKYSIRHKGNARGEVWNWNDCSNPDNIILAVTGNKKYWDRWRNRNWKSHIATPITEIKTQMSFLNIKFYSTDSFSKKSNRNENGRYGLDPLSPTWKEIRE